MPCAFLLCAASATSALADALYMPLNSLDLAAQRAATINCAEHLRQILAAAHTWSIDNLDQAPPSLQALTNELSGPTALFCPANLLVAAPTNWDQVDWSGIDYTWLPTDWSNPTNIACTCRIHNSSGLVDGSVSIGDYRPGWPVVTAHPPWIFATPGENVRFDFNYSSNALPPVTFQWRREYLSFVTNISRFTNPDDPIGVYWRTNVVPSFNATSLPNQTNLTLFLSNVQPTDNGFYSVAVSNVLGLCTSHPTKLLVDSSATGVSTNEHWSQTFCLNNLKMIGLAAQLVWTIDNYAFFPQSLQALTNHDGSPVLGWPTALFCRADTNRSAPAEWSAIDFSNTSYEILPGDPENGYAIFCRCRVHGFYVQMNGEVLKQPHFNLITRLADGRFNLSFRAFAGRTNLLETSNDLLNWTTLKIYDSAVGDIEFIDSPSASLQRFYRLRLP